MKPDELHDLVNLDWVGFLIIISLSSGLFIGIWKLVFKKYTNGLIYVQGTSAGVFAIVTFLLLKDEIQVGAAVVFFGCEILALIVVIFGYKSLLATLSNVEVRRCLARLSRYWVIFTIMLSIVALYDLYLFYSVNYGGSRLSHKVTSLYTFVRILKNFSAPLLYILFYYNLRSQKYTRCFLILTVLISSSIFSGSKSGFLLIILTNYFIFKDLTLAKAVASRRAILMFSIMIVATGVLNLFSMGVKSSHLNTRIINFAEAPIMVLGIEDPTNTIFKDSSYFSIVHRSLGKLVGDAKSHDLDTLFGFRLHEYFYGGNTLVGPNARIGAVFYSFFNWPAVFFSLLVYLCFIRKFHHFHTFFKISSFTNIAFLLLLISTYQDTILDYNKAISNISAIIILYLGSFIIYHIRNEKV